MIGYSATNAIGQALAAREKIYSFSLSYFVFLYRYLPFLSFGLYGTKNFVSLLSELIFSFFEKYVITTEDGENAPVEVSPGFYTYPDKNNKGLMAKYYLKRQLLVA